MAQILNPSIRITPTSFVAGGRVEAEVTYTARFTPMERLLAAYGLAFHEIIELYDVDNPAATLANDDLVAEMTPHDTILASEIAGAASNHIPRSRIRYFDRPELRGPDDDGSLYWERIRARILIFPVPHNPMVVQSDIQLSNYVSVHTQGPTVETAPFPG